MPNETMGAPSPRPPPYSLLQGEAELMRLCHQTAEPSRRTAAASTGGVKNCHIPITSAGMQQGRWKVFQKHCEELTWDRRKNRANINRTCNGDCFVTIRHQSPTLEGENHKSISGIDTMGAIRTAVNEGQRTRNTVSKSKL